MGENMRLKSAGPVVAFFLGFSLAVGQSSPSRQLIRDVRVFDGERVLEHRSVLIENGKIRRIGDAKLKVANAEVIEGAGRTLIPGLFDAHVHIPERISLPSGSAACVSNADSKC